MVHFQETFLAGVTFTLCHKSAPGASLLRALRNPSLSARAYVFSIFYPFFLFLLLRLLISRLVYHLHHQGASLLTARRSALR
jgi:hypothetical protein